ncbi:MAG TPA: helix-hairpin-helix domain-containing protein [Ktedonobacteraceae bacterium]|nr:helix-hairpin-helix domain-containing protein [Ktedonobacteraceae bacterium]
MVRKPSHASRPVESAGADDLKRINGIGPAVESRLHGVGIFTFAKLAALSPADIAASVADLTGMTAQRIIKQDWIGQARQFAVAGQMETVEDEDDSEADTDVPISTEMEAIDSVVMARTEPAPLVITSGKTAIGVIDVAQKVASKGLSGVLRLQEMEILVDDDRNVRSILASNQPVEIRLTLDLSDVVIPGDSRFAYKVSIYGRHLGERARQAIGETSGTFMPSDRTSVTVKGRTLSPGIYYLEAIVMLSQEDASGRGLIALAKRGPLHFY